MFSDSPELDLVILTSIHDQIINASGGLKGYHDIKLLQSALGRPIQSAFGEDAYEDVFEKAAALLDSLANNHGFKDGNKRTAMAATAYYLIINNILFTFTNKEYEEFVLHVVNAKPSIRSIKQWIVQHSKPTN